ncbi:MAG: phosphomannomutase/phosphoglucomutase [Alphaproteobacteria bacterium]|nr:phosphomannomutase/phosphoglucomutase [Alphaproteobacteria bacterium]
MGAHSFNPTILREYDIRGVVGETLTEADAQAIGRAFGTRIVRSGGKKVMVGYDGRLSSPDLERALVEGLAAAGVAVHRVGRGPTPMLYFAAKQAKADGGIMVTGSHNPPNHNGFKMVLGGASFYGEAIRELAVLAAKGNFAEGKGEVTETSFFADYVARLAQDYHGKRTLNVAWDAGNGAAGEAMAALAERLPGTHHLLNATIDGTFPVHHPDPTVEANLEQLRASVLEKECDLGIAFDGDGDRIGVLDGKGRVLWGDQLMVIFAKDVLKTHPGAPIIADVKASQTLFDEIAKAGGEPVMWRTGHSLIKAKMAESKAPLAGEMSGHIFFADRYYGFDDALYAAVRILDIVARSEESLAGMRDALPSPVNTPELRLPCPDERKFVVLDEVKARLAAKGADAGFTVNDVDGVRVETPDGWWLLRASNTQAVLVARIEAKDAATLERLKGDLVAELEASGVNAPAL